MICSVQIVYTVLKKLVRILSKKLYNCELPVNYTTTREVHVVLYPLQGVTQVVLPSYLGTALFGQSNF